MTTPDDALAAQRKALAAERAATRKRLQATRLAAKTLAAWVDPNIRPEDLAKQGERWIARLGEENIRRLAMRLRHMAPWELARAEQMRDAGASGWMMLKYVGAEQDMVIDGPACRDTIYTDLIQYSHRRKREKGRETLIKLAIPLAVVATVATIATAGVGYVVSVAGAHVGMDPQLAAGVWEQWKTIFTPVLSTAKNLATNSDVATASLMFGLGAFWMWAHDSRVAENLRAKAAEREVPALEIGIGFAAKSARIQSGIRAIPPNERILLSHLSSTDLRAFLLSTDDERIHMLRENRPPLIAQFKSILAGHPRQLKSILPALRDIADVCLPKKWARAVGAKHLGEIGPEFMQAWRAPKNSLATVPGQEHSAGKPVCKLELAERLARGQTGFSPDQVVVAVNAPRPPRQGP